jgi:hypothetical protein
MTWHAYVALVSIDRHLITHHDPATTLVTFTGLDDDSDACSPELPCLWKQGRVAKFPCLREQGTDTLPQRDGHSAPHLCDVRRAPPRVEHGEEEGGAR